jgi:hypothetical protein
VSVTKDRKDGENENNVLDENDDYARTEHTYVPLVSAGTVKMQSGQGLIVMSNSFRVP